MTFAGVSFQDADFLKKALLFQPDNAFLGDFNKFRSEVISLRKNEEDILTVSEGLRQNSRDDIDGFIDRSRVAILTFFLVFLIMGTGTFFVVGNNLVSRLKLLAKFADETLFSVPCFVTEEG
jgi:hypothetical protein